MNSCKIVTVCSPDAGLYNHLDNAFVPFRHGISKEKRKLVSEAKSRIQSAVSSTVLRPVTIGEKLPNVLKQKVSPFTQRCGSVDSELLRKEIKSAVLLLESRNERDIRPEYPRNHSSILPSKQSRSMTEGIGRASQCETLDANIVPSNDTSTWKRATNSQYQSSGRMTNKLNLRVLPSDDRATIKVNSMEVRTNFKEFYILTNRNNNEVGSLEYKFGDVADGRSGGSGFLGGFKRIQSSLLTNPQLNFMPMGKPLHCVTETHRRLNTRENVLREYMDVYMHWRTANAIEEYQILRMGRSPHNKSAKIRHSTPKQRLEQFQKTILERRPLPHKAPQQQTSTDNKEVYPSNEVIKSYIGERNRFEPTKAMVKEKELERNIVILGSKQNERDIPEEDEEESTSDVYSEIDWLECCNF